MVVFKFLVEHNTKVLDENLDACKGGSNVKIGRNIDYQNYSLLILNIRTTL